MAKGTLPFEVRCRARAPKLEPAKIDSEFEDKALGHKAKQEEKRNEENRRDHCYSEEDNSGCVGHELRYSKVLWCEARILTLRGGGEQTSRAPLRQDGNGQRDMHTRSK